MKKEETYLNVYEDEVDVVSLKIEVNALWTTLTGNEVNKF